MNDLTATTALAAPATPISALSADLEQRVNLQADAFVHKLIAADLNGEAFRKHVESAFKLGRKEIAEATRLNTRFLKQNYAGLEHSPAYQAMAQLRSIMDALDPGKQGDLLSVHRILGFIPGGLKLRTYLRKFVSAETQINELIAQLSAAQDDLERDVIAIDEAKAQLWTAMQNLQAAAHFAHVVQTQLEAEIDRLKLTDIARAKALEQEALFHAVRAREGILSQQAVTVNGYLALDPLKKTAREMSITIDRLKTTGMSALAIAQMIAIATGAQARVQQALAQTRDVVSNLVVQTSAQLNTHVQTVSKAALDPVIEIGKLQTAFDHTFRAIDSLDALRATAIGTLQKNQQLLQGLLDQSRPWLERAAAGPRNAPSDHAIAGPVAL